MRHLKKKKLGKGTDHRRKLLRALASSAILYERITTSYANARGVRPYLEKIITRAKEDSLHNRRIILSALSKNAAKKVLEVYGPKYKDRKGGYLRLTKLNNPKAGKSKVLVEFVE
ncbi:MAG TPA: 50S ribosomal protein L17 [Patescibacteria group bacterium]|nr:50S ribosomal protein L17 [Patescibacteria group bacterium]